MMSKKTFERTTKPLAPDGAAKHSGSNYPVEHDLNRKQEPVKKVAAAAVPTPPATPKLAQPQAEPKPAQVTSPVATAPKPSPPATTATPKAPLPALAQSPAKTAVVAKGPMSTPPQTVKTSFVLVRPNAKHVSICGEFNGWSSNATPMTKHGDSRWETTLALEPGRYQYKFLVDGEWIPDPLAHESVPNQYGSLNSVTQVRV
jgi:hypothetical protein